MDVGRRPRDDTGSYITLGYSCSEKKLFGYSNLELFGISSHVGMDVFREIVKYITEVSLFSKDLKNVRQEILLTSAENEFGLENLRSHMYVDLKDFSEIKKNKNKNKE